MRKFCFLLIVLFGIKGYAQVNLQTGASQISLPLFSYSDKDNLDLNINLNYIDGNGLKVNEVASAVGTGWNLECGGVIIREQRGLPDDQKRSDAYPNPLPANLNMTLNEYYHSYFPNGYLFSAYNPSDNISNEGGYIKMYTNPNINPAVYYDNIPIKESIGADREQDIFHLNYGKGNAEFVIGKNGQIKVLNDTRIKIEMFQSNMLNSNIKTWIDYFIVTGTDGIQYIFSDKELSIPCTYNKVRFPDSNGTFSLDEDPPEGGLWFVGANPNPGIPVFKGQKTQDYIVTKWYLSKILNPRSNKAIFFNYESFDIDILGQRQFGCIVQTGQYDKRSLTIERQVIKAIRLKKIICPTSQINFVYGTTSRIDLPNGLPLTSIEIANNDNTVLKKYLLQYEYFFKSEIKPYTYAFNADERVYARLCLKSLQEIGNDGKTTLPPYSFEYYTGGPYSDDIVPPTFSYFTDHWGFFNAHALYDYPVQPNQIPNGSTISNICINAATAKAPINGMAQNGIIKQITYPLGGVLTYEYEQNDAFYGGQNIPMGGVRTKRTILYDGINHNKKDIIKEYKYLKADEISSSGWGYELPVYSQSRDIRIYKEAGGKVGKTFGDYASSFATTFIHAKGLSFSVKFGNTFGPFLMQTAVSIIVQVLVDIFTSSDPAYKDQTELIYSNISNETANPLPYQYSRIEVVNKSLNGDKGKTVFEFTSNDDKPIDIPNFTFPFPNKDRFVPWAYGLPKKIAVYNNNTPAQLLKETINTYNYFSEFMTDINFISKKWEANRLLYDVYPSVHAPFDYPGEHDITEFVYYPQTGHTELTSTIERTYDKNGSSYSEKITNFTYNSLNFQPKTITSSNSKEELLQKRIYYPEDYTIGGFITDMKNANIVNTPVSTETWVTKAGEQPQMISSFISEFGFAPNADIKLVKNSILTTAIPLTESQIGAFNPSTLIRSTSFIKPQAQIIYDVNGSAIESIDLFGNRVSSSIYDYNNTYTIADIKNASSKEVAYTSFEADGTGGWSILSGNVISGEGGITGRNRFSGNLSKTFVSPGNYIVTLWVKGGAIVTVNGGNGDLLNTINDWKLYSWNLSSVTSVSVSGANYDEVRLYPPLARMRTVTYDPLIGKTSECDENNHIIYYNYDVFGRLKEVKDEKGNVIKAYEYNYIQ